MVLYSFFLREDADAQQIGVLPVEADMLPERASLRFRPDDCSA